MAKVTTKYQIRKADRLNGRHMKSRHGEGAPWYTWRTPGIDPATIADPIQALNHSLSKFGEGSRFNRQTYERNQERAGLAAVASNNADGSKPEVLDPEPTHSMDRESGIVRALVKRAKRELPRTGRPLPKFSDLGA